jgi:DNA topoisomerase-1
MTRTGDPSAEIAGAELAASIGLAYGFDDGPGIRRRRSGRGFSYIASSGRLVSSAERERCEALVIPPAWTEVWISPDVDNHVLATGVDDAGRKQYVYHPRWREARDEQKFDRLGEFAHRLVDIRSTVAEDLLREPMSRRQVLAAAVRTLDATLIRIGSERYADDNETFGLTTLERRHLRRSVSAHELRFVGKSGSRVRVAITDPAVQATLDTCAAREQPQLFCFESAGEVFDVTAAHVNDYLAEIAGPTATAKTFRTWGGTIAALDVLTTHVDSTDDHDGRIDKIEIAAVDAAAEALGNTRAVCRSCYVAPRVLSSLNEGRLAPAWRSSRSGRWRSRAESTAAKLLA